MQILATEYTQLVSPVWGQLGASLQGTVTVASFTIADKLLKYCAELLTFHFDSSQILVMQKFEKKIENIQR